MDKKKMAATITVEWGYDDHSITLTPRNWDAIKAGRPHSQRGAGYYYGAEFFWDYWQFSGGLDGDLTVDYGRDGGQGFTGKLRAAEIQEHRPKKKSEGIEAG
jgi:hypothetical protein